MIHNDDIHIFFYGDPEYKEFYDVNMDHTRIQTYGGYGFWISSFFKSDIFYAGQGENSFLPYYDNDYDIKEIFLKQAFMIHKPVTIFLPYNHFINYKELLNNQIFWWINTSKKVLTTTDEYKFNHFNVYKTDYMLDFFREKNNDDIHTIKEKKENVLKIMENIDD
tara:strand:+ start:28 stop:522 length:495 start_codon:yes stop_codon:yes gene_type:complete